MARLIIELDATGAVRSIRSLEKEFGDFDKQIKRTNADVKNFEGSLNKSLKSAGALLGGVFVTGQIIDFGRALADVADTYTLIDAKIDLVTDSQDEFNASFERLYEIGRETGSQLEVNAQAFQKLGNAMRDTEPDAIIDLLETTNQSLVVAGATTQEASSFMLQFGQAMGSATVQGDELRSMVESNSYFMGLIADNLGVTIRGLKEMGAAGTLTRDVMVKAIKEISDTIEDDFATFPVTIDRAMNSMREAFKRMFTDADQAVGGSNNIAMAIENLANTVEDNREEISEVFAGIIDGIPGAITGIQDVAREVMDFSSTVSSAYNALDSLGGPSAAEWGIIGAILLKGPNGLSGLLTGLVLLNSGLKHYGLNLGSLVTSSTGFATSFQNIIDVITGVRDWNTGELLGDFAELDKIIQEEFDSIDNPVITPELDLSSAKQNLKELTKLQKASAQEWLGENEKAIEKTIAKLGKEVDKLFTDIANTTLDFDMEERSLRREGMTNVGAYEDINRQLDEYKQKAEEAAMAGDWKGQEAILLRIKSILNEMPNEVRQTVDQADVDKARQMYEYQMRITRGGKGAWGDAAVNLEKARKHYQQLLRDQKQGYTVVKTEEQVLAAKLKETEQVNKDILESKRKQAEAAAQEKADLEAVLAEYKAMAEGTSAATGELKTSVEEVGPAWEKVGDTWERVGNDIITETNNIEDEVDSLIGKLKEADRLGSGSGGSSSSSSSGDSASPTAFARGGFTQGGETIQVGEQGVELFTPSSSGHITPNSALNTTPTESMSLQLSVGDNAPASLTGSRSDIERIISEINAEKVRYRS